VELQLAERFTQVRYRSALYHNCFTKYQQVLKRPQVLDPSSRKDNLNTHGTVHVYFANSTHECGIIVQYNAKTLRVRSNWLIPRIQAQPGADVLFPFFIIGP
jgi:hypothetical protein